MKTYRCYAVAIPLIMESEVVLGQHADTKARCQGTVQEILHKILILNIKWADFSKNGSFTPMLIAFSALQVENFNDFHCIKCHSICYEQFSGDQNQSEKAGWFFTFK